MVDSIAPTIAENKVLKASVANLEAGIKAAQEDRDRMEAERTAVEERLTQAESQKNGKCRVLKPRSLFWCTVSTIQVQR
jgi:hypothetical protein